MKFAADRDHEYETGDCSSAVVPQFEIKPRILMAVILTGAVLQAKGRISRVTVS
jgi:hypothetical protein